MKGEFSCISTHLSQQFNRSHAFKVFKLSALSGLILHRTRRWWSSASLFTIPSPFLFPREWKVQNKKIRRNENRWFWSVCLSFESGCGRLHRAALPPSLSLDVFEPILNAGRELQDIINHNHLGTWDLRIKFEVSSHGSRMWWWKSSMSFGRWMRDAARSAPGAGWSI